MSIFTSSRRKTARFCSLESRDLLTTTTTTVVTKINRTVPSKLYIRQAAWS